MSRTHPTNRQRYSEIERCPDALVQREPTLLMTRGGNLCELSESEEIDLARFSFDWDNGQIVDTGGRHARAIEAAGVLATCDL